MCMYYDILFFVILTILSIIIWFYLFIYFSPNQIEVSKNLILNNKRKTIEKESLPLIPYSMAVYKHNNKNTKNERENVFVHIMPQNYHFFVEQGQLIYHPTSPPKNNICCTLSEFPEIAYVFSVEESTTSLTIPQKTKMCRRPLEYLKSNIYTLMTYRLQTHHLKNPLKLLHHLALTGRIKLIKNDN